MPAPTDEVRPEEFRRGPAPGCAIQKSKESVAPMPVFRGVNAVQASTPGPFPNSADASTRTRIAAIAAASAEGPSGGPASQRQTPPLFGFLVEIGLQVDLTILEDFQGSFPTGMISAFQNDVVRPRGKLQLRRRVADEFFVHVDFRTIGL
jgi:hypothetical protein